MRVASFVLLLVECTAGGSDLMGVLQISQITCSTVPTVQYIRGAIESYFRKELSFSPMNVRAPQEINAASLQSL